MYRENSSGLQNEEKSELFEKIKAETSLRMKLRYDVILLHMEGYTNKEISRIHHLAPCTVGKYVYSYEANGVESLAIHKEQGIKSKMTLEQEKRLYDCITTKYPAEVGFVPHMNWTAPLACQWLEKEEGIHYSERGMRNVFERLKLSYTRPTYTLKKADLAKQAAFQEEFVRLKKLIFEEIDHILFEDESMLRDYQEICKTWFAIGQQRIIPTYGKHGGVKLVGVLDYQTGAVYVEEHGMESDFTSV